MLIAHLMLPTQRKRGELRNVPIEGFAAFEKCPPASLTSAKFFFIKIPTSRYQKE
jgi:hypothetical protein